MRIEIVVGNIVHQPDVDALVNSANANLRFGSGVAGAISVAAGGVVVVVPVASWAKATGAMAVEPSSMAAAIVVRVFFMVGYLSSEIIL